jgi:hypothetical protein
MVRNDEVKESERLCRCVCGRSIEGHFALSLKVSNAKRCTDQAPATNQWLDPSVLVFAKRAREFL